MRRRTAATLCWLVLVGLGLAACTSSLPGTATSNTPHPSPTTGTSPGRGGDAAPTVAHPLDASAMIATPCSALTSADIANLGLVNATGRAGTDSASKAGCSWVGDSGGIVSINWVTANRHGLSDLYAKSSTIAYWQPTTVGSYPAVYGDALSDGRSHGDCVLSTAVSDQLYFFAQIDNPLDAGRSCARAATAAADVIRNLGGS